MFRQLAVVLLALLIAGCTASNDSSLGSTPYNYSEKTVSQFMGDCLRSRSVGPCLCILDRFRAELPDGGFAALSVTQDYRRAYSRHAIACGAEVQRETQLLGSPPSPTPPLNASQPSLARPEAVERTASDAEACFQERLVAAAAKMPDGSLPIADFERLKAECGA